MKRLLSIVWHSGLVALCALAFVGVALGLSTQTPVLNAAGSAPYMVRDINPDGGIAAQNLMSWHGKLYFQIIVTPHKNGVWSSDGTEAGTTRVKRIKTMYGFSETKKHMYFMANDGKHDYEPWVTDGTRNGTFLVKDLNPPGSPGNTVMIGSAGELGYILQDTAADDYVFWRTNGTAGGTRRIAQQLVVEPGVALGKILYFPATERAYLKKNLYKSDGTAQGTQLVKQLTPSGSTQIWGLDAHAGQLRFFSTDNTSALVFWRSDGSTDGTVPFKNLGTNVYWSGEEWVGDLLFFVVNNLNSEHYELWVSDGTENGTEMIYDMGSSDHVFPPHLQAGGRTLYFAFEFGALFKSDGTTQGTTKVADTAVLHEMESVGSLLFFANTGFQDGSTTLWQSDGTSDGTFKVADPSPTELTRVGDTLFFVADDGTHGTELWAYKP